MQHQYAFEKMVAWQIARQTTKSLYLTTRSFPKEELFGVTSQVRRACISISCNLAEGSARLTTKDQNRFYSIAYGSAIEVINLLIVSNDLEYLNTDDYNALRTGLPYQQTSKSLRQRPPRARMALWSPLNLFSKPF